MGAKRLVVGAVILAGRLVGGGGADAKDYFLAIGGGFDASGNPASLERDVRFAAEAVAANATGRPAMEIYFADGDDPARDVQFASADAADECPAAVRIMAELFGDPAGVGFQYRDHELAGVAGPTDFTLLERRFRELGRELSSGDRLLIYAAGHGGEAFDRSEDAAAEDAVVEGDEEAAGAFNHYNTSLNLWNRDEVTVIELGRWLDRLPPDVTVMLVMGQCYSGGFAHVIFQGADAELGLSPARRCGFFSQLHDRGAAGCTADLNVDDVREYSSYFWAALGGKTRDGAAVSADYDGDGETSFAEAHAYAVIASDEIDVPVRTSEALLRAYSRLGGPYETREVLAEAEEESEETIAGLREPSGSLAALAALARPDQRAILEQLPQKIGGDLPTVEAVRVALGAAEEELNDALDALDAAVTATDDALTVAQDEAYENWPELYDVYSTAAAKLTASGAKDFAARVEQMGSYGALTAARKREAQLSKDRDAAECAVAKLERLLRTVEDVVLAENLAKVAPKKIVTRYEELVQMEEAGL